MYKLVMLDEHKRVLNGEVQKGKPTRSKLQAGLATACAVSTVASQVLPDNMAVKSVTKLLTEISKVFARHAI